MTLNLSSAADFLPELEDGISPCEGRAGQTTNLFGTDRARAKISPAQESKKDSTASETSGPRSSISSASAALSESLASRLKMLCATVGSTVYTQTWKERVTPAGLSYWEHTARAPTTSDKGYTGWPTPKQEDSEQTGGHRGNPDTLHSATQLAGWATPRQSDPKCGTAYTENCEGKDLAKDAQLAGWASPASRDYKDTPGMSATGVNPDGSERSRLDQLPRQASLAISGPTPDPTSAKTASGGVLNPAFSRWLQSYPAEWCQAAILAWRNMPTKRRKRA